VEKVDLALPNSDKAGMKKEQIKSSIDKVFDQPKE
jgi:hypothetical protein